MEKVVIDSKPDRPEDLVMITLNTDYVSLDLYHGLTKKNQRESYQRYSAQRKLRKPWSGLRSFVFSL